MLTETPSQGDQTLLLALEALEAADYQHALTLVNEALEQGISWDIGRAEALNLRGTFKYVHRAYTLYSPCSPFLQVPDCTCSWRQSRPARIARTQPFIYAIVSQARERVHGGG